METVPSIFEQLQSLTLLWVILGIAAAFLAVMIPIWLRIVVPTNEVHIVQSGKATKSYGKDMDNGNTYYAWPSWLPKWGVVTSTLPLSVFSVELKAYEAYDIGRLPFVVDVIAFFRISDAAVAAERIFSFTELQSQLQNILQGAVRSILAKNELEGILSERSTFGEQFTAEVGVQLKQWGCSTVKNIEFMDIRDSRESSVILNIMDKKKSLIEMESRTEVANNHKLAEIAEITAKKESDLKRQDAELAVGVRTAEKDREVGISNEKAQQDIKAEAKITAERDMAVKLVQIVKQAEITKDASIVKAEETKRTTIIVAEGRLEQTKREAEGALVTAQNDAAATKVKGEATALAEKLMQMAAVDPQITLAKEIGSNEGYQKYLVDIRSVEKDQVVGIEQAQALKAAGIKVIANTGNVNDGVKSVMDLFTPGGGLNAGAALEALSSTDAGAALLKKFGIGGNTAPAESVTARSKKGVE